MGRAMALDVGTKTIGVAVSDPLGITARPLLTIRREGVRKDVEHLAILVAEQEVTRVIVGLPLELDGTEERSARLARQIGTAMGERTGLPVTYIDERFTSVEAERRMIEVGVRRSRRKEMIDQVAAVLILESYLRHGDWTRDGSSDG